MVREDEYWLRRERKKGREGERKRSVERFRVKVRKD